MYDGIWTISKAPFFGKKESKLELVVLKKFLFSQLEQGWTEHKAHLSSEDFLS